MLNVLIPTMDQPMRTAMDAFSTITVPSIVGVVMMTTSCPTPCVVLARKVVNIFLKLAVLMFDLI